MQNQEPPNHMSMNFDRDEFLRYSRHFALPQIGLDGQAKLKAASVLVIGAGGLGNPVTTYLAAAGIGHLGIVDFDVVNLSNLQRQVLFTTADIGRAKSETARQRLQALNPHVEITTYNEPLLSSNAEKIATNYDLVIDGTDNFPTRYLVNDICVFLGKPNVYGSIYQFSGQVSLFHAAKGPCYRCLFPEPPPAGLVPSCAEGGVLGVLPGIVGSLQATEAVKWITGIGDSLMGRLLLIDALTMEFHQVKLRKNPNCPVCGDQPTITTPIDYEYFCGLSGTEEQVKAPQLTANDVKAKLDAGENIVLLDVREEWEWQIAHLDQALFIPLHNLPDKLDELDPSQEIVVYCHTGKRSAEVATFLMNEGFTRVSDMTGGIRAWAMEVDPALMQY